MDDDDSERRYMRELEQKLEQSLAKDRIILQHEMELFKLEEESRLHRKNIKNPSRRVLELWEAGDAVRRQRKALWLREILEDYEF